VLLALADSNVYRFHNFSAEILSGVEETTYGGTALLSRTWQLLLENSNIAN